MYTGVPARFTLFPLMARNLHDNVFIMTQIIRRVYYNIHNIHAYIIHNIHNIHTYTHSLVSICNQIIMTLGEEIVVTDGARHTFQMVCVIDIVGSLSQKPARLLELDPNVSI